MNPKFSVIVTLYNVAPYLPQCLASITEQTYQNLEIILIDDGSTDGSATLADDFARKDSRVQVVHQANTGVVASRVAGLNKATGDYVIYVDGDDYCAPDLCAHCARAIQECHPDIINWEGYRVYRDHTERMAPREKIPVGLTAGEEYQTLFCPGGGSLFADVPRTLWTKAVRRELYQQNLTYLQQAPAIGEDCLLLIAVFFDAQSFYHLPEPLYYYRKRHSSLLQTHIARQYYVAHWQGIQIANQIALAKVGRTFPFWSRLTEYALSDLTQMVTTESSATLKKVLSEYPPQALTVGLPLLPRGEPVNFDNYFA